MLRTNYSETEKSWNTEIFLEMCYNKEPIYTEHITDFFFNDFFNISAYLRICSHLHFLLNVIPTLFSFNSIP